MRYFFDTEFIEDGKTIDLVSIGIVCDDGLTFYGQSSHFNANKASPWVQENVLAHLEECPNGTKFSHTHGLCKRNCVWFNREQLKNSILDFIGEDKPEFWGYYADYDWVVLCQLFGTMMDLPKGWTMYCRDLKQLCDDLGNPKLPEQGKNEHHALADAVWNQQAYKFLKSLGK